MTAAADRDDWELAKYGPGIKIEWIDGKNHYLVVATARNMPM